MNRDLDMIFTVVIWFGWINGAGEVKLLPVHHGIKTWIAGGWL